MTKRKAVDRWVGRMEVQGYVCLSLTYMLWQSHQRESHGFVGYGQVFLLPTDLLGCDLHTRAEIILGLSRGYGSGYSGFKNVLTTKSPLPKALLYVKRFISIMSLNLHKKHLGRSPHFPDRKQDYRKIIELV